jgi:hypothetical protein
VEAKVDIKSYAEEVDAIKLNQWLHHMEVYFSVHEVTGKQNISFARSKLEGHALIWWESDAVNQALGNEKYVVCVALQVVRFLATISFTNHIQERSHK